MVLELKAKAKEYIEQLPEDKLEYAIKFLEALLGKEEEKVVCESNDWEYDESLIYGDFEFVSMDEMNTAGIVFDEM